MYLFLLASFPLYLCLVLSAKAQFSQTKFVCVVRYCSFGIFIYIPVYLLSRLIPQENFFVLAAWQVFQEQLLFSREAYFHIASAVILFVVIGQRYRSLRKGKGGSRILERGRSLFPKNFESVVVRSDELFCWLTGYFLAANFQDFLLLGPFPTDKNLFFLPLSRILFVQSCVSAFASLQLVRYRQMEVRIRAIYATLGNFLLAFVVLNIISSTAIIFNIYGIISVVLLVLLLLFFCYSYLLPQNNLRNKDPNDNFL